MDDNLVQSLGTATWTVCAVLTSAGQAGLQASLDRACAIPAGCGWERRTAAHAEFFTAFKFLYLERTVATPSRDRTPPGQASRGGGMTRPGGYWIPPVRSGTLQ
jgi:hypothetical protein